MTYDPIPALQTFGYTEREAAFLYLVSMHSGYFLRRQFDWFIDRNKGSIVSRFIAKARAAGHIEVLDYKQGWYVYHLCSRMIYRLCGDPESQLRRRKADVQVRMRLMALDFVLGNEEVHYLAPEAGRVHYFEEVRGVGSELFVNDHGRLHPLLTAFPISLTDRERPARCSVRFTFIDEGLSGAEKFLRFLDAAEPLLRAVGSFEVVHVANSSRMLTADQADVLTSAVRNAQNILIAGGTGSGKTTLLNVLSDAIPDEDRILTIEDTPELSIRKPHIVSAESQTDTHRGQVGFDDLLKAVLRHRPDRILVGEVRGAEARTLLGAMNTGHRGTLATIHASKLPSGHIAARSTCQPCARLARFGGHRT